MAAIDETFATLRFSGDALEPDTLTALLGKPPSNCARKGDALKSTTSRQRIAKTGRWHFDVAPRTPGDLDGQIEEIFSQLSADMSVWKTLGKHRPNLFVGLFLRESNEGLELSPQSIAMLADRGVMLGFDIYGPRPALRSIQIVDSADNATFSVFQATDAEFKQIFPVMGQEMEISEDFAERVGDAEAKAILDAIWERPILKRDVSGIDGTLFFNWKTKAHHLPPSKREVDTDERAINAAQRTLFTQNR